jgi:hypothetical protein
MLNAETRAWSFELASQTDGTCRSNSRQPAAVVAAFPASVTPSSGRARSKRKSHLRHTVTFTGDDPWSRTLAAILHFSDPTSNSPCRRIRARHCLLQGSSTARDARAFTITVLERLANSLVALSWHDPTRCNHEEQVWSPSLARRTGQCALSGMCIKRGDSVYRPRTCGGIAPLNGDAMILTTALKKARKFSVG